MTSRSSTLARVLAVSPKDRFFKPIDPWLRHAKPRFVALLVAVLLLHLGVLAFLLLHDHRKPRVAQREIPVQVVVLPPKPQPKLAPKPKPKAKPRHKKQARIHVKAATDTPPKANPEKTKRESTSDKTQAPVHAKPVPKAQMKPVPKPAKPAQNAAPKPKEHTASPIKPQDLPDAKALSKETPTKAKPSEKIRKAKHRAPVPRHQRATLARELAALSQSPHFSIAAHAKPSPISGGHCHTVTYLCTLYGLIMRHMHYPHDPRFRYVHTTVVVAFWLDSRGDLIHQALYRTSGYPDLDRAAIAAIRAAAPFPPPPYGSPHGFVAQMAVPPK